MMEVQVTARCALERGSDVGLKTRRPQFILMEETMCFFQQGLPNTVVVRPVKFVQRC
jgi:hypothetical protein